MVAGSNERFIFIDEKNTCKDLYELMPNQSNKVYLRDTAEIGSLKDQKNNQDIYIFCNNEKEKIESLRTSFKNQRAINILEDFGRAEFYSYDGKSFSKYSDAPYHEDANLFSVIFSENYNSYSCNMEKALKRTGFITDVLIAKSDHLNTFCPSAIYTEMKGLLDEVKSISVNRLDRLNGIANELHRLNQLLQISSCPVLY